MEELPLRGHLGGDLKKPAMGRYSGKLFQAEGIVSTKALRQGQVWLSVKERCPATRDYRVVLVNLGSTQLPGELPKILMRWPMPRDCEEISLRLGWSKRNFKRRLFQWSNEE